MKIVIETTKQKPTLAICADHLNGLIGANDFFQARSIEDKILFRAFANSSYQLLIGIIAVWQTLAHNGYTTNYGDHSYIKIDDINGFYTFITSIKHLTDIKLVI